MRRWLLRSSAAVVLVVAIGACTNGSRTTLPKPTSPTASSGVSSRPTATTAAPRSARAAIYIGAVELAPEDPSPGGQYVLLVNGRDKTVDVACWAVRSTGSSRSARIVSAKPLAPGAGLRLIPDAALFQSSDTLVLLDRQGRVVDRTPRLSDRAGDDQVWFRASGGTWSLGRAFTLPDQVVDGRLLIGPDSC
jgi:hypothetical protein